MLNVFFSSHLQYTIHFYNIQKGHFNAIVTDEKSPRYSQSHTFTC